MLTLVSWRFRVLGEIKLKNRADLAAVYWDTKIQMAQFELQN